jgi:hypothetical protein
VLKQQETKQKKAGNHVISIINTPITPNQDELDLMCAKATLLDLNIFFFGSDLVFIFARLAWFFAFARTFALWCFFITLFCLLLGMFTPTCSCL